MKKPQEKQKVVNTVKMNKQRIRGKDKDTCAHWVQLKKTYFEMTIYSELFIRKRFCFLHTKIFGNKLKNLGVNNLSRNSPLSQQLSVSKAHAENDWSSQNLAFFALGVHFSILGKPRTPKRQDSLMICQLPRSLSPIARSSACLPPAIPF